MNEIISVNAVNKLNLLTNDKLINERKKLRTELKVQLLVKTNGYVMSLSITLIQLTVNEPLAIKMLQIYCEEL